MRYKLIPLLLCFVLVVVSAFAISDEAATLDQQIKDKNAEMLQLRDDGFAIVRYNDTLLLARQFYNAQLDIEKKNGTPNYDTVKSKLQEVSEIKSNAYLTRDELSTLELIINKSTAINKTILYDSYDEAFASYRAERYEESLEIIEDTYSKISELEAAETKLRALYDAYSRTFLNFLKKNIWNILITIAVLVILFLVFNKPIRIVIIDRQIQKLEVRAKSVNDLVAETQKEYFDQGSLNESTYHTRIKKYGELLRDIHRQIPLLRERRAMVSKKGDNNDEKENTKI
ncbi:hypothetical protein H6503_05315 [Candidatus Woesearchaeota archaeon]|nr:hypothetical protein [Candidatus Woesearchaeota archaeon]